jgi:hypothetical protein
MTYGLSFNGTIFHSTDHPPKLVRLGSGEILQWVNTKHDLSNKRKLAIYEIAKIDDYKYIHNSDLENAL